MSLDRPKVMGILNVTPDSFYADSRMREESQVRERVWAIVSEGGDIIDVGACSTRPGGRPVSQRKEMERLRMALSIVRRERPQAVVSVDTFRPDVARMAVEEFGVNIINDVGSGADATEDSLSLGPMMDMVSYLRVPYILTSHQPTMEQTLMFFARYVQELRDRGQKDIIIDPGFGFGKTLEQNYAVLSCLEQLQVLELPVLVGVSRKSMITGVLGSGASEALNGTTALHAVALMKGASILRAHDVREAVECCKLAGRVF